MLWPFLQDWCNRPQRVCVNGSSCASRRMILHSDTAMLSQAQAMPWLNGSAWNFPRILLD